MAARLASDMTLPPPRSVLPKFGRHFKFNKSQALVMGRGFGAAGAAPGLGAAGERPAGGRERATLCNHIRNHIRNHICNHIQVAVSARHSGCGRLITGSTGG